MRIELTRGDLMPNLLDTLRRSGCRARRTAPTACRVVHPTAATEHEARLEIAFFLRAWELAHPGVRVRLS